jgi:hypothetical protein
LAIPGFWQYGRGPLLRGHGPWRHQRHSDIGRRRTIETDHVQYGSLAVVEPPPPPNPSVVPLPAGLPLLAGALGLMAVLRRRT